MNDSPMEHKVFQTNTGQLWAVGVKLLPDIANHFSGVNLDIHRTRALSDDQFHNGPTDAVQSVYLAWNAVRNDLEDVLAKTATNINVTATAMVQFADDSAEQDSAAADDIAANQAKLDGRPAFVEPKRHNEP